MDTDIRKYIIENFKDSSPEEIEESIIESINSKDEIVLPGLGVMLEIIWSNSNDDFKKEIIKIIHDNINSKNKNN